jgi:hypothetical protein
VALGRALLPEGGNGPDADRLATLLKDGLAYQGTARSITPPAVLTVLNRGGCGSVRSLSAPRCDGDDRR